MRSELTERQKEILEFLTEFAEENGYPPTIREICSRFGIKSTRGVVDHLAALERKGYMARRPELSRGIEIKGLTPRVQARAIPLVGRVAAGAPLLAEESIEDHIALDPSLVSSGTTFLLRVEGQSMIDAHILPGDMVVVRKQDDARDGDIVVALLGDEATVKRLSRREGRILLVPDNASMEPIPVDDPEELRILGIVTGLIRKL